VFARNTTVAREQPASMGAASWRCSQKNADNSDVKSDELRYL
jgi:hypothetical protein